MSGYLLYMQKGRSIRNEPNPLPLKASNNKGALALAIIATGANLTAGRLKPLDFYAAGAEKLCRKDGTKIFPKRNGKIKKICAEHRNGRRKNRRK